LEIPTHVGTYAVRRIISEGASAFVLEVTDAGNRLWALKLFKNSKSDGVMAQISQEVESLKKLNSSRVARFHDLVTDGDLIGLVMEFVPGKSLRDMKDELPLSGLLFRSVALALIEALEDIHSAGLVHRDLKPENVIFGEDGVKIVDFGISLGHSEGSSASGETSGTPLWISPEQAQGAGVSPGSDVFNLGMVLAFAASGNHPFGGGTADAVLFRILKNKPTLEGVPEHLKDPIEGCLEKDQSRRPDLETLRVWIAGSEAASSEGRDGSSEATVVASRTVMGRVAKSTSGAGVKAKLDLPGSDLLSATAGKLRTKLSRKGLVLTASILSAGLVLGAGAFFSIGGGLDASGAIVVRYVVSSSTNVPSGPAYLSIDNGRFQDEIVFEDQKSADLRLEVNPDLQWKLGEILNLTYIPSFSQDADYELVIDPEKYGLNFLNDGQELFIYVSVEDNQTKFEVAAQERTGLQFSYAVKSAAILTRKNERQEMQKCISSSRESISSQNSSYRNAFSKWETIFKKSKLNATGTYFYTTWASRATTAISDVLDLQRDLIIERKNDGTAVSKQQVAINDSMDNLLASLYSIRSAARAESGSRWDAGWDSFWTNSQTLANSSGAMSQVIASEVKNNCDASVY
jgi:predicted Ser/Thr protein kinase